MNEFSVHFFIMKNAGYKHHITLPQGSLQKQKHIGQCTQIHLLCHQPILRCGFLAATDYALKRPKALIYGILPQ